ncbi:gamma-glutamyl-gamma-aminobutyrate hydrolase family protein [Meiothermus ruber]|jgi:putative glutamine amidotransferase|uniref:Peptidase C26 n=1 Tax=Meiothermus ruber (strain ATCC 35948 / DSM 1279 / VKM B-1258 / 21) TaxID=504728 RepID=D3PPF5_MEIRD|nr:gamma-glutamyl-gamma-aminobutyrate hydrolase family protein [Meiothermus ruber]ADD27564.1 peptidase C26 [Meiothermus ruber DSM 1279]AGK04029.1 peptidase C26 [Meiothermus ruber DSM 1279]MCL6529882.1 gamma-glutamyl-gamma-aminobutyrate hydrolase family protein [Meiothermus ruber]GAO74490.1 peptidase C26 [Meiothermus ruber H328]
MLIGVTPQSRNTEGLFRTRIWGLLEPYVRALESQGASIVILPPQADDRLPALLRQLDGVLLPGGVDVDPAQFGEEPIPELGEVSLERDAIELFVARYTAQHGIPTLGICRGIQVMNVALGGSLYQDLSAQGFRTVQHSQKAEPPVLGHSLELVGPSPLDKLFEGRFRVNSYHHQALRDLAPGLRAVAAAPDGIVEAVLLEGHPFYLGVQWHPELLPAQWGVFRLLVEAAASQRAR